MTGQGNPFRPGGPRPERCTLHDLACDGDWPLWFAGFRLEHGRIVWEGADYTERGSNRRVRVQRLETVGEDVVDGQGRWIVRVVTAYLPPETLVVMVEPIDERRVDNG